MSKFLADAAETQIDAIVAAANAVVPTLDSERLRGRLRQRLDEVIAANQHRLRHERDAFLLATSAIVLAGRDALRDVIDNDAAIFALLKEVFVERRRPHVDDWLASRLKITADDKGHAFERAAENFKAGGEAFFGDSFAYAQEVQEPDRSFINVERCFFNDFFRGNYAPELTPLFCALDIVWADQLNAGDYNVRFERTSVLSAGDDKCRFRFSRR